jgi:hypothetical protein
VRAAVLLLIVAIALPAWAGERSPAPEYLVICPDGMLGSINTLVDWKEKKGVEPLVIPLSQIGAAPTAQEVKDEIEAQWSQHSGTLRYVLLVGDTNVMPFNLYYNNVDGSYYVSDHFFAVLGGDPYYPELLVGRLPAATSSELDHMVWKTVSYERTPYTGSDWFDRGMVASGSQYPSQRETKLYCRDRLLESGYSEVDTVFSGSGGSTVDLITSINGGLSVVNARMDVADAGGWGDIPFTVQHVYGLGNGQMMPFLSSITCLTGNFNHESGPFYMCLGEAWLRAPNAGVAFFGASQITHTAHNNDLDKGLYDAFAEGKWRISEAIIRGKELLMLNEGQNDTTLLEVREYNLLGCPELELRSASPGLFTVEHPTTIELGPTTVTVQVYEGASPFGGALVCLRKQGEVYEHGYTDGAGEASFNIQVDTEGSVEVTVTNRNMVPYEGTIAAQEDRYLIDGALRRADSTPLTGFTVNLSGHASASTSTGNQGSYQFTDLEGGYAYTVTPVHTGAEGTWTFDPPSRTYDPLVADQYGQDFTGYPPTYEISGFVRRGDGTAMEGVTVDLTGGQMAQTTTSADGSYGFYAVEGGLDYTVTPSFDGPEGTWSFNPPSMSYQFLSGDQIDQDYTAYPPTYSIAGAVRLESGQALIGVDVYLGGSAVDSTVTALGGAYAFTGLEGGYDYFAYPRKEGPEGAWDFEPDTLFFPFLSQDWAGQNFVAYAPVYTISGTIRDFWGNALEAVKVAVQGGIEDSVWTDAQGAYAVDSLPGGLVYTLTPSKDEGGVSWFFTPASVTYDTLASDYADEDYIGQLPVVLDLSDGSGQPGTTGNPVDLSADNSTYAAVPLGALSFNLQYDASVGLHLPDEGAVVLTERCQNMTASYTVDESQPSQAVAAVALEGGTILPGTGPVAELLFSVDAQVAGDSSALDIVSCSAEDTLGQWWPALEPTPAMFVIETGSDDPAHPASASLTLECWPNPAGNEIHVRYRLVQPSAVRLSLHHVDGRLAQTLFRGTEPAGWHERTVRPGEALRGAVYCVVLEQGERRVSRKVVLAP